MPSSSSSSSPRTVIGFLVLIALASVYISLLANVLGWSSFPFDNLSFNNLKNLTRTLPSLRTIPILLPSISSLSPLSRPLSSTTTTMSDSFQIAPRRSEERGHADHEWLKTFHTFSFAMYQESGHDHYGCLRVINEDRVAAHNGFGTHSHREFEIFSYVVEGELEHKDSMGNTEILSRGHVQLTSAGTGISHSEKAHGTKPVHFLQIWSIPSTPRLTPKYFTRFFSDEEKTDKWVRVVAPVSAEGVKKDLRDGKGSDGDGDGPAPVQSPLTLYASIVGEGKKVTQEMTGTKGYFHVIMTSGYNEGKAQGGTVKISGSGGEVTLREGDGAYLQVKPGSEFVVENVGDRKAEVLLFDLA
ncbi:hypothetical protein D9758_005112 [Tetrapyrgos nigripes]|uniref:Pirin N-terminal domain-containing protein n=1 Tax=Tetrapyrgos nigripes TaxID=182062 RepID=A0A8H5GW90_9AGAR|nr:hypothetical protein D9758_005112 [Tetrapyrgos nigripes]